MKKKEELNLKRELDVPRLIWICMTKALDESWKYEKSLNFLGKGATISKVLWKGGGPLDSWCFYLHATDIMLCHVLSASTEDFGFGYRFYQFVMLNERCCIMSVEGGWCLKGIKGSFSPFLSWLFCSFFLATCLPEKRKRSKEGGLLLRNLSNAVLKWLHNYNLLMLISVIKEENRCAMHGHQ